MTEAQLILLRMLALDYREWDALVAFVESIAAAKPEPSSEPPHKDRYL